ncbi:hypothetical protein PF005_g27796 [Phytophthora fragariae]|uniref:G-protein coupled receptors family 2 profile 2 domain-containing protein n=2 Tax=Phytophthora fragariae TaxID=53985 RepID=A0A6A4B6H3_9STRA|nr:hypothetical protein PF003_g34898 [Phytophthora fragariae]KAE8921569.1 hypothetical protein PF009_g28155 [Phytophthora fragariae]KAE9081725.1 hypothetical protein PF006_g27054 [Phytophthora fragariae]KAE9169836.1 hypothetical protein PF005_g27796 [Phytophthora fragariae]KAE9266153.1 hypothetical protein PF001_g30596 [Phytophthora fragariae]
MKNLLQLSVLLLAVSLVPLTWYATLMPRWLSQSGERGDTVYYSQGMGLWLNYTEHVGDPKFDPGNSLWVPPQESGVDTYSTQCAGQQTFCADVVGELHKQYCQVMEVYCGTAMTFLQLTLSVMAGSALVVVVWAVHLITTTHNTMADKYLMHLCVFNGVGCLTAVMVWYVFVFRLVVDSTFYKDQYNRCSENDSGRTCWQLGWCVYLLVAGGVSYPLLAVLVISHATNKFRRFQQLLRRMHETAAVVEVPPPLVDIKSQVLTGTRNETVQSAEVALDVEQYLESTKLAPLKKHPSAVLTLKDDEQEEKEPDTKHHEQV